jgi:predicted CoA-binding protein
MAKLPTSIAEFLEGERFAVTGVSRSSDQPANSIYKRLKDSGYEVFPVNPSASEVEGVLCYPDLASVPKSIDGVVIVTHPKDSIEVVRQCSESGIQQVWFHRSIGDGSVSEEAVKECGSVGIDCIVGGMSHDIL